MYIQGKYYAFSRNACNLCSYMVIYVKTKPRRKKAMEKQLKIVVADDSSDLGEKNL